METNDNTQQYRVWGADNVAYGPVELPTLVSWIRNERVTSDTWVFLELDSTWLKATQVPELKMFFQPRSSATSTEGKDDSQAERQRIGIKPGSLRRIKIFADMDEKQLESFLHYIEVVTFKQFAYVVRKGDHGDAMYLVLEGELRALTLVDGKESTLSTMTVGEFFGEISLLDHGPRSADVIANQNSVLLKISAGAFEHLTREAPALALPFLYGVSKSVVGRLRTLTKRYEDSIHFARTALSAR